VKRYAGGVSSPGWLRQRRTSQPYKQILSVIPILFASIHRLFQA